MTPRSPTSSLKTKKCSSNIVSLKKTSYHNSVIECIFSFHYQLIIICTQSLNVGTNGFTYKLDGKMDRLIAEKVTKKQNGVKWAKPLKKYLKNNIQ